jgi:N-acyl-D-amino-acid deacylase
MVKWPLDHFGWVVIMKAFLLLLIAVTSAPVPPLDILIRNGLVLDGTGRKARRADVGIRDGRIVLIGGAGKATAREVIDATGLIVAPGFIDVHTHADDIADKPAAENFVRMGVTTVVAGNCGSSPVQVGPAFEKIQKVGIAINFATLVGHNSVREAVMGNARRAPSPQELSRMKSLVAQAMADGAVGFSTGLQYVPGAYAEADEIIELAKSAASAGGLYASHMRNEGTEVESAVRETIRVGEEAGCPVEISHLKIDSPSRWGSSGRILDLIDSAVRRGVRVRADQYAYAAASSSLGIRFPSWALEGNSAEVSTRLGDPATWEKIRTEMKAMLAGRGFQDLSWATIASCRSDASLNGLSIKEVALKRKGGDSVDAQLEVAREILRAGGAQMVYHSMSEPDIRRIMRHPLVAVASDADILIEGQGIPHPRGYGNNARVLGHYVRELRVIPLEEAVRKMTSLPAAQFGFSQRGEVRVGYAADLVLFRKEQVADRATYPAPHQYAVGIPWVLVNGMPVVREGKPTGARPGQVLRRKTAEAQSRSAPPR